MKSDRLVERAQDALLFIAFGWIVAGLLIAGAYFGWQLLQLVRSIAQ